MPQKTEVLIVKNPFYYKELAPEAYERLMESGGKWIPLVFGVVEKVVSEHFLKLCELDWAIIQALTSNRKNSFAAWLTK